MTPSGPESRRQARPSQNGSADIESLVKLVRGERPLWTLQEAEGGRATYKRASAARGGKHRPGCGTCRRGEVVRGYQALWRVRRCRRSLARHLRGRVLLAARSERVWQDNDAAYDRRLRGTYRGRYLRRREGDAGGSPLPPARQHRLPVLRHLPSPQRLRQRGLRAAAGRETERRDPSEGRRSLRDGAATGLREAQALTALRRPAAASRSGEGSHQPAEGVAPRRASGRAGPQAAQGTSARAKRFATRGGDHVRLRHPRPG